MRIVFKVWNILLLIFTVISAISIIIAILGIGEAASKVDGSEKAIGGLALVVGVIGLIPVFFVIFMARAGLKEDYDYAAKLATVVLILDVIGVILADDKTSGIVNVILMVIYIYLAKSLQKSW